MRYAWHFTPLIEFTYLWGTGLLNTLLLTLTVLMAGTVIALFAVGALYSKSSVARRIARSYVDLLRAIPALVLLGTLYFTLPVVLGINISSFTTAAVALSLNLAPFVVECIRGAIDSVPTIQFESAMVLGFTGWRSHFYIIGPQVLRRVIPPLVGQYITTLKLTSLAAAIGVQELWNVTSQITTATSLPVESRLFSATLYVAIILPLLALSARLERHFDVKGLGLER